MKRIILFVLTAAVAAVLITGCAKKQAVKQDEPTKETPRAEQAPITRPEQPAVTDMELRTVYFEFDSYEVREDAKPVLREISKLLRENSAVELRLEGHADERGTIEYNLALGEKRAVAVRDYLTGLGLGAARMSTFSYGEERPAAAGHDEEGWARNRRVEIVPVKK